MGRSGRWKVLGIGVLLLACVPDFDAPIDPADDAPFVFEVPKGTSARGLGPKLDEAGLVGENQWWFYTKTQDTSCLKAGKFELKHSMSVNEIVKTLCGPPLADDVPFTVVEGWRIRDIDAALAEKGWIEPGAYTKVATEKAVDLPFPIESPTLEGYLYPETYKVPAGGSVDV
ncbi:MAG: endolytic transglycosylase MltG, partial [Myxococcota bacterium]